MWKFQGRGYFAFIRFSKMPVIKMIMTQLYSLALECPFYCEATMFIPDWDILIQTKHLNNASLVCVGDIFVFSYNFTKNFCVSG